MYPGWGMVNSGQQKQFKQGWKRKQYIQKPSVTISIPVGLTTHSTWHIAWHSRAEHKPNRCWWASPGMKVVPLLYREAACLGLTSGTCTCSRFMQLLDDPHVVPALLPRCAMFPSEIAFFKILMIYQSKSQMLSVQASSPPRWPGCCMHSWISSHRQAAQAVRILPFGHIKGKWEISW